MTEASVSFAGNLTDDPEVRFTANGVAVATFRLAVTPRVRRATPGPRGRRAGTGRV